MEVKLFNKIPYDRKTMERKGVSKVLKTFLINRAYYSIEEFVYDKLDLV